MGGTLERAAGARLLRECVAGCDVDRFSRCMRDLFWDDGRAGLRVARCRRYVGADCAGSSTGAFCRSADIAMIRVVLPPHLKTLAKVGSEVELSIDGPVTQRSVLDALEAAYPMLCGTIRDHGTLKRRAVLRFFACQEDLS